MVDETETQSTTGRPAARGTHATADPRHLGGSLDDLRAFCAIVDFGTVSAAARELGETKGSISRRVSRLERRLGIALLARTPRAVTPTGEGTAFHARARDALALLADASEEVHAARSVPSGHLRVTAPVDIGIDILPDLIAGFRRQYPQITVEMLLTSTPLDLATHRIDLALRATAGDLPDMDYRAAALLDFSIRLYAAPAWLATHGEPTEPDELSERDLVMPQDYGAGAPLTLRSTRGRTESVPVRPVIRTGDYASVHRILRAGGGIGPLPEIVAAPALVGGELQAVLPEWSAGSARLHAISLRGREAPARVRLFRDFIRSGLSSTGP
jgi:DNA-binding transcriptional LysR family regulator